MLCLLCACTSTASKPADLRDLLVDASIFPQGWHIDPPQVQGMEDLGQVEGVDIQFLSDAPGLVAARQILLWYRDESSASKHFDELQLSWFNDSSVAALTPWVTPAQLPYRSAIANKSRFACSDNGIAGRATVCQFLAQYRAYVVIFHTIMTPENYAVKGQMTFPELQPILEEIDRRMTGVQK
jgi:hypothetical protein